MIRRKWWVECLLFFLLSAPFAFPLSVSHASPPATVGKPWADSVLQTMSLDQKIAQLMMLRIHSNKGKAYNDTMIAQLQRYQWGGYCFFQAYPVCQARLTNRLQEASRIPLMISIDGEWGLGMRLDSVDLYPRQMAMGAGRDTAAIYEMGRQMALQCHRIGVHVNFAPDVDINNNPQNPVINSRSFGSDPFWVSRCGIAYMKGMQDHGVMATAKHFPGHGDTETDSHAATPTISHSYRHLQKTELSPFAALIRAGVDGVMVGHLKVPALDSHAIATLSHPIQHDLLREQMGFDGLVITDALEMKGIHNIYPDGELEVRILLAGADMLLLPLDPVLALQKIREAVQEGVLSEALIDACCLRVLRMKEKYVLPYAGAVSESHLVEDLNSLAAQEVTRRLSEASLTLLKNRHHLVPIPAQAKTVTHLRIGNASGPIDEYLQRNYGTKTLRITLGQASDTSLSAAFMRMSDTADVMVVTLSCLSQYPKDNYGLHPNVVRLLETLSEHRHMLLVVMGNPYCLNFLPSAHRTSALLVAYHPTAAAERAVVEALAHHIPVRGKLPVEVNGFEAGEGISLALMPELQPYDSASSPSLPYIDSLVRKGLEAGAYPGCRVVVTHRAKVVYDKSFGNYSYQDRRPVSDETLYDLASVTKSLATTMAVMLLYEQRRIRLEDPLSDYLPYLKGSNKEHITIAEIMTHTAGLKAWMPFYTHWGEEIYRKTPEGEYTVPVCDGMYMRADYRDSIRHLIAMSPLKKDKSYLYSDMGFYLLADMVKAVSGQRLDTFLTERLYRPMGMAHTCFNPYLHFPKSQVAPTENDQTFRHQEVCAYVHDQGAAMMGGVCGHAGLFSTAGDLARLLQMLLNGGTYRGVSYFRPETVAMFTRYYYPSGCRRALGFDKPSRSGPSPCGSLPSPQSYGHSGFTGTFFWVDPAHELGYIFLSNRVSPDASNTKLSSMNIRTDIQDYLYQQLTDVR